MTVNLLIGIITCSKYADRAQTVNLTWARDARQFSDVRFFRGGTPYEDGTEVVLDVDDGYTGLPAKVQGMCKWAYDKGYEYIFKTDDDCYVNPRILTRLPLRDRDYLGRFRGASGGYPANYASGFGYFLSRRAMKLVIEAELTPDWAEDRWIGNLLAQHKVTGWAWGNDLFAPVSPPLTATVIFRSNIRNAAVFCEFPSVKELQAMHQSCGTTPTAYIPTGEPKPQATAIVTKAQRFQQPTDKPAMRQTVQHMDDSSNNFQRALVAAAQAKGGSLTATEREQVRKQCTDPALAPMKACPVCGGTGKIRAK